MYKRALILATAVLTAMAGPFASAAFAGGTGDGWTDGNGVGASASAPGSPATADVSTGRGQGVPVRSYEALTAEDS